MINNITLGELTATTRPICYGVLKPGKLDPNGIPLVRVTDISSNFFNDSNLYKISPDLDMEFSRSKLKGGEVLLSIQGTVGRVAICPIEYAGANISRTIAVIEPDQRLLKDYLKFYFIHMDIEGKHYSTGSTRASLNISYLRKLKIPLPPLDQQKKIAAILDTADAYRQKTKVLIEKYDALTQSFFLEMFGDTWTNPMGWDFYLVEDLAANEKHSIKAGPFGSSLKKEYYVESGYKIYGQEQVIKDDLSFGDYYIDESKFLRLKNCKVKEGDILISLVGTYGKIAIVPENYEQGIINPRLMKITPNQEIIRPDFLKTLLRSSGVLLQTKNKSRGGTMDIVNVGIMRKIKVPLPPIELQNQFAERVQAIEAQKAQAQASLAGAEDLFNSLLQRAFKGELV
jgi:type I restriction enzyme S subunit